MNSCVMKYFIYNNVAVLDKGGFLTQKFYIETFPVPVITETEMEPFHQIAKQIIAEKRAGASSESSEKILDQIVCTLYGLSSEEVTYSQNY